MAKNEYYIVFENEADGKESPTATNKKSTVTQEEKDAKALTKGIKGYASLKYAENVVDRVLTHKVNTVELRTGHAELQQRMELQYGVAKRGIDIISSAVMAGSVFGGVGAVIGGIAGVADAMINIGIRQSEINMRREVENTSLFYARIRAGAGQDRTGNSMK